MLLEIEPIPRNQWGLSLARLLPYAQWNKLRRATFQSVKYICQVCGDDDSEDLNCHEVWKFDDEKLIQTLQGLESCCSLCHNVHHFGRSKLVYKPDYVRALVHHWCEVNELTPQDFEVHEAEIAKLNARRVNNVYRVFIYGRELGLSTNLSKRGG